MKKLFIPLVFLILACSDDESNPPCIYEPTLTTEQVTDISESSATLNGAINISSQNCEEPENKEQGFVYSTEPQPTLEDMKVNVNGTTISTTIENLEPDTTYYVRAFLTNSLGDNYGDEVSFITNELITVPDAPTITDVTAGDGEVEITFEAPTNDGGSAITEYTAISNPGEMTSSISQAEGGTITVDGLTNGTAYTFTITATNAVGTSVASDASDPATPVGVPDAPTITDVTAGDGEVEITFEAPTNDGGSAITEYTAISNPGEMTSSISQAEGGTITVDGLTNGTAYTFTITATNAVGTSEASEASDPATPVGVPDAPTITDVTAGDGEVEITFDAPTNDGGSAITEYKATSSPGEMTSSISQAEGGTITVDGLTNGTAYTFTITATNGEGTSEASEASSEVTPVASEEPADYPEGTVHCDPNNPTDVVDVTNPVTGKTWMDRNLGASQVAESSTDADAYGDLYQWGRGADGHQCRDSQTTTTLSSTDQPGHGDFILTNSAPTDWRSLQNENLWQGADGVNNPCPSGYRLPTEAELEAERLSWSRYDASGAIASPLKLPMAGYRGNSGSLSNLGTYGLYWSSTDSSPFSRRLFFGSSDANMNSNLRAFGYSVRCIKD